MDRASTCALSFRKWSWRVPPGGLFWGGQWPGKNLTSLGSFCSLRAFLTWPNEEMCPSQSTAVIRGASQSQVPVLRTTPSHTPAQVHSVRRRSFVFQRRDRPEKKAKCNSIELRLHFSWRVYYSDRTKKKI
ncbi:hypothetical protein CEXT_630231 [Caerostris extrusa]|uniref:Uncharacterized protein n=1 Tax=Caerostris extrusa TaxID=172846 RepID=A0AAV4XV70_CAEEX|nr:hypothetical protein CEXT_630231 [Caerostris extrusa]